MLNVYKFIPNTNTNTKTDQNALYIANYFLMGTDFIFVRHSILYPNRTSTIEWTHTYEIAA